MIQGTSTDDYAIDIQQVQKRYRGGVMALRDVEMKVHRGEVFGLLGPNGAGKSTLVKIMMTVVRPTNAVGSMLGEPIGHKPTLTRVGYLPEHHRLPQYLTGAQVLHHYAALSGVPRDLRRKRADELLDIVGMRDWASGKIRTYSKGMMQRIGLAQALMNDPDLIVLDEPTDGVDPLGRRDIRDVLVRLKNEGHTIFLNSHLLSELEMVCDRVSILVQGRVAMQGTIDDLTAESRRYEISIRGATPAWVKASADVDVLDPNAADTTLYLSTLEPGDVQPVIDRLRSEGTVITGIGVKRESLEELFMRAVTNPTTGETLKPGAARGGAS